MRIFPIVDTRNNILLSWFSSMAKNQFYKEDEIYVFDPKKEKPPGSFKPVYTIEDRMMLFCSPSVFLHYKAGGTVDSNKREFELRLFHNGKIIGRDIGVILESGDNEEYEDKINKMRMKAAEALEGKK